jgi:hypothetical protein
VGTRPGRYKLAAWGRPHYDAFAGERPLPTRPNADSMEADATEKVGNQVAAQHALHDGPAARSVEAASHQAPELLETLFP